MGTYPSKEGDKNGQVALLDSNIPSRQPPNSAPMQTDVPQEQFRSFPPSPPYSNVESKTPQVEGNGDMDDDVVPTVFRWEHGGRNVYITGTFNNWERQIPMHRSGNDFSYVHNLKRGKHAYKFIVDDEWRYAPDQPTVADMEGRTNNFIDVSEFIPYTGDINFFQKSKERKIDESEYGQVIPDIDDYTKEPPALPPHLRLIILNKAPPSPDPLALPSPQHVSLNHLYCTAIKDGMMVLGVTQRYRSKHMTLVFYSVMPG
tara:strand:- start:3516 stop:4292 length:777 start_codon:yes stop_codon:yes gene_type:complete